MKKRLISAVCGAAVLLCAGLLLQPAPPEEETQETVQTAEYVLADYGGHVAVFCPQRGHLPREITTIEVQHLPSADRLQLQNGIPVASAVELAMLLEDLGC